MREYYVYIMSNWSRRLYVGVTNNLLRRVQEHKEKRVDGYTSRYVFDRLVHFETTTNVRAAIAREKQIKGWLRERKLRLIEEANPGWDDLSHGWYAHGEILRCAQNDRGALAPRFSGVATSDAHGADFFAALRVTCIATAMACCSLMARSHARRIPAGAQSDIGRRAARTSS
jgi:putative endonuclease